MPLKGVSQVRGRYQAVIKDIAENKTIKVVTAIVATGAAWAKLYTPVDTSALINSQRQARRILKLSFPKDDGPVATLLVANYSEKRSKGEELLANPNLDRGELAKAAYFRGFHEKASEFKGIAPDFAKYDATAANRQTLRQLPDVSDLAGRAMPKQRAHDGNSL